VVWDEDPATAAKLLAGSGYVAAPVKNQSEVLAAWPRTAVGVPPGVYKQVLPISAYLHDGDYAVVFFHRLTTPSGRVRLARVHFMGGQSIEYDREGRSGEAKKTQVFAAVTAALAQGEGLPTELPDCGTWLALHPATDPLGERFEYTLASSRAEPGTVRVRDRDVLRIFSGQPDPADPSHFTIAYERDGAAGVIDGWLRDDDRIRLIPRDGKVLSDRWYPDAK